MLLNVYYSMVLCYEVLVYITNYILKLFVVPGKNYVCTMYDLVNIHWNIYSVKPGCPPILPPLMYTFVFDPYKMNSNMNKQWEMT